MRPGILHPGRQRDCFSFDQLRARGIDVVVREVGPHICIKRDLPGRLLGGRQSGRGDATSGERQEGSAVEHDTAPWIDLPSISKATWISRGADSCCHITGGAALLPSGEDGSSCRRSGLPQHMGIMRWHERSCWRARWRRPGRPPRQQRREPGPMLGAVDLGVADDRECAGHEQAA